MNDGKVKQYLLNKIADIRPSERKFKRIPQEQIDEMFQYSFRSWVGSERHQVKIHLSKIWGKRLKVRQMMEAEIITQNEDGSVVFETIVNSLAEIASWVVTRGEGVTVLEPPELKEMVVGLANGALANYQ